VVRKAVELNPGVDVGADVCTDTNPIPVTAICPPRTDNAMLYMPTRAEEKRQLPVSTGLGVVDNTGLSSDSSDHVDSDSREAGEEQPGPEPAQSGVQPEAGVGDDGSDVAVEAVSIQQLLGEPGAGAVPQQ